MLRKEQCCVDAMAGRRSASAVGELYGVSSKTVRDIWMGRTWYRETFFLEPNRADATEKFMRRIGRPKGAKDKASRKLKDLRLSNTSDPRFTEANVSITTDLSPKTHALNTENNLVSFEISDFGDPFHDDWPRWPPIA